MNKQKAQEIIKTLAPGQNNDEMLSTLFEKIRDIPYGSINSRDPLDVFIANKGTCSGKHELLKALYHEIGYETKDYIAIHAFNDLPVDFPINIKSYFDVGELLDPHNFFKVKVKDKWVIVDATWEKGLSEYGFTINQNWKGDRDCEICVVSREIIETSNPLEFKSTFLNKLPLEIQNARKDFLSDLTVWLDNIRKNKNF